MNLRLKIIKYLLKEDEEVIKTTTEPKISNEKNTVQTRLTETATTKTDTPVETRKPKKTRVAPIVYGTDVRKGVIKKRADGYWAYWNIDNAPKQKRGEYNELVEKLTRFQKSGCTTENWYNIMKMTPRKKGSEYIHRNGNNYILYKKVDGKQYSWGTYDSLEKAEIIRDYLKFKKWDLTYLPKKFVGGGKMRVNEYYLQLLPFIYGDDEYAQFRGGNK